MMLFGMKHEGLSIFSSTYNFIITQKVLFVVSTFVTSDKTDIFFVCVMLKSVPSASLFHKALSSVCKMSPGWNSKIT